MKQVNMHEAKTHLSRLVEDVANGEEVVIARAGKPVAKLVPFVESKTLRKPGSWKGKVWMADDFDDWTPELDALFYGKRVEEET